MQERPFTRLRSLVEAVAPDILPALDKPFAFFGHSMGALVSFELARYLRRQHGIAPAHLFVSGRSAPQMNIARQPLYDLPEPELVKELRSLNGTPPEVLEHPELMELVLPLVRADFAVCDTYLYQDEKPLDCPLSAYGGLQDADVPRAHLENWGAQTTASFKVRMFPGNHFFLHSHEGLLLQTLARELQDTIVRA
jgi:medium-chain acyl-[acyl-carrier-protein] hydrolase